MTGVNNYLRHAAKAGNEAELKDLLLDPGCDPMSKDEEGVTALMFAAFKGASACVQLLLPLSNALNKDRKGSTALIWAAGHADAGCTKILLPFSDALAQNNRGWTALIFAGWNGATDCVRLLLPESDVFAESNIGVTAMGYALSRGHVKSTALIKAYLLAVGEVAALNAETRSVSPRKGSPPRV